MKARTREQKDALVTGLAELCGTGNDERVRRREEESERRMNDLARRLAAENMHHLDPLGTLWRERNENGGERS